jgi:hypothetical protein
MENFKSATNVEYGGNQQGNVLLWDRGGGKCTVRGMERWQRIA